MLNIIKKNYSELLKKKTEKALEKITTLIK